MCVQRPLLMSIHTVIMMTSILQSLQSRHEVSNCVCIIVVSLCVGLKWYLCPTAQRYCCILINIHLSDQLTSLT